MLSPVSSVKVITFPQQTVSNDCDCDCDCNSQVITQDHLARSDQESLACTPLTSTFLELTPACNNRCIGCSNVFITDKPTRKMEIAAAPLTILQWQIIIDKLAPFVDRVSLTGGEPTLYKYFAEFTALLDQYQLGFTLFTNARWRQPETIINTFSRTVGLKGLLISLHGHDALTHEAFTLVPGSFEETVKNIKLATQAGISVTLSTIITRYSYAQTQAIYELGQELGVRQVAFNRYVGLPTDDSAPTPNQLKRALTDIETLRLQGSNVKLTVTVPQCFHPTSATGCGAGEAFVTVDPWGNVKPCNHTPMILGNLLYDSVESIMATEQLDYWRNLHPAGCDDCAAFAVCGGGCRAEAMLNQQSQDSLIQGPFLPGQENFKEFFVVPDYLHPISTQPFTPNDFIDEIDWPMRQVLVTALDGSITLKELGMKYGQGMLDLIGTMHKEGLVEFV